MQVNVCSEHLSLTLCLKYIILFVDKTIIGGAIRILMEAFSPDFNKNFYDFWCDFNIWLLV